MDHKELKRVIGGILITPLPLGVPLFLAAGTFDYWQGWLFLLLFTVSSTAYGLYIMKHDPALLERRMRVGPTAEKRPAQQIIMSFVVLFFFLVPVVAGLDFRFGWSEVPTGIVFLGNALVLFSFFIFHIVCKVNSFASATIELTSEQKVVSTGPYGIVRHPMYSGALILMLGMPLRSLHGGRFQCR